MSGKNSTKPLSNKIRGTKSKKEEDNEGPVITLAASSSLKKTLSKLAQGLKLRNLVIFGTVIAIIIALTILIAKFLVIAFVDNLPITRIDLYRQLEARYGQDMKNQLVSEALVLSEARKRGTTVSNEEVEKQFRTLEEQQGGAAQLAQVLESEGMTQNELKKRIKFQLLIEKMFGQDVQVTDQEVEDYIKENKNLLPQIKDPNSSEAVQLKANIKEDLRRQKIGKNFQNWLRNALSSNRVIKL